MTVLSLFTNPKGLMLLGVAVFLTLMNPFLGLISIIILAYLSQAIPNGVLESMNIPVVPPTLFLGSEPDLHKTVTHLEDIKRAKKYGGIWGTYIGRQPQVHVTDPELIKLIFVKDFVHFGDRREVDFGTPLLSEILDFLPGEKWKTLRTCMNPLFTTSKLKQMSEVIAGSAAEFMDDLKAECNEKQRVKFETRKRLTAWLIDMFAQSTLGVQLDDRKNPDNKFALAFREMMGENIEFNLLYTLSLSFPFLTRFAPAFDEQPARLIESTFRQIIESRKRSGQKNAKDFLDVLSDLMDRVKTKEFQDLKITEQTVIAQAINFFLGGYETSVTILSHLLLYLAENPEVQEKMHKELMETLKNKGDDSHSNSKLGIDHELLNELPYISACINEAVRLAPPVVRPERICTKDWEHNGLLIKKGTIVMMPSWPANRNPDVFEKPDDFIPERFLENKNLEKLVTTFGFGPRHCIGVRFGYETLKLFACNFVKNFRVEKRPDTKMVYKKGALLLVSFEPLYLDIVKRQ